MRNLAIGNTVIFVDCLVEIVVYCKACVIGHYAFVESYNGF